MITSRDNERLKLVRKLESKRWRDKLGLFVAEGEDLVAAALDAGIEPVEALVDAERPALDGRLRAEPVEPRLLAEVSSLAHPPRIVAVFRRADLPALINTSGPGLALWHVADPGNVGALVRTADAFGAFIALSAGCADPVGLKATRASMGAVFRVALVPFDDAPRPWIALATRGGERIDSVELPEQATFVLGAEREGLPAELEARCDLAVTIPLAPASESLNVAAAGAVALYEWRRRR